MIFLFLMLRTAGEGDKVDLYCHGSLRYQASTTVVDSLTGVDTGRTRVGLQCTGGMFVNTEDQVGQFWSSVKIQKNMFFLIIKNIRGN